MKKKQTLKNKDVLITGSTSEKTVTIELLEEISPEKELFPNADGWKVKYIMYYLKSGMTSFIIKKKGAKDIEFLVPHNFIPIQMREVLRERVLLIKQTELNSLKKEK